MQLKTNQSNCIVYMACTRLKNIIVLNVPKTNQSNWMTCTRLNNITVLNVLKINQSLTVWLVLD